MTQVITPASNTNITHTPLNDGHTPLATASNAMDVDPPSTLTSDRNSISLAPIHDSSFSTSQASSSLLPSATQTTELTVPTPVLDRPRHIGDRDGKSPGAESSKAKRPTQASALSTNLISLFKLDPLASTVARFDPKSGEKINKLRKSYENYLKTFSIAGKNKAIKHEDAVSASNVASAGMMGLAEMAAWPDEEWHVQKVSGKPVEKGLPEEVKDNLENAFSLNPGKVPEGLKWDETLGLEKPSIIPPTAKARKDSKGQVPLANGVATAPTSQGAGAADTNNGVRTTRGVKRGYNERDYEGYKESFKEEEIANEGYESGETHASRNSRGSKGDRKRRKMQDLGKTQRKESFVQAYGR